MRRCRRVHERTRTRPARYHLWTLRSSLNRPACPGSRPPAPRSAKPAGLGEAVRKLPRKFEGQLPAGIARAEVFCGGCLVLQGGSFAEDESLAARVASDRLFADWPLIVLHDDAGVARSSPDFLWATWTRFEPASDIYAAQTTVQRHHLVYTGPIVIDARTKPGFPDELIVRVDIKTLVDRRWGEYFKRGLNPDRE